MPFHRTAPPTSTPAPAPQAAARSAWHLVAALAAAALTVTMMVSPSQAQGTADQARTAVEPNGLLPTDPILPDPTDIPTCGQPLQPPCDTTPPETRIDSHEPSANDAGWVDQDTMSISFSVVPDEQVTYECRLDGPSQAADWAACTSPQTYSGLADTATDGSTPYLFSVRATDTSANTDPTPATLEWDQDTTAPFTWMAENRPRGLWLSRTGTFSFSGPSGSTFVCRSDGKALPCDDGGVTLSPLRSGKHTFSVAAKDPAGNVDPTPETTSYRVPFNTFGTRRQKRAWDRSAGKGYFDSDYQQTKRRGAKLSKRFSGMREVTLIVGKGRGYGLIRVNLGSTKLYAGRLTARRTKKRQLIVIDLPGAAAKSGKITVVVLSQGKMVRIDGISVR